MRPRRTRCSVMSKVWIDDDAAVDFGIISNYVRLD